MNAAGPEGIPGRDEVNLSSSGSRPLPLHRVAARVVQGVLNLLAWTLKVEVRGWEHIEAASHSGRPMIFAAWHGDILTMFLVRLKVQLPYLITMISRSKDGDLAAAAVRRFGTFPVRGSSSRGGAPAVLAFRARMRAFRQQGRAVAGVHLVDGPRGPRHRSKPGVLALARQNEALIVPLVTGSAPCRYAKSWDRHAIPLPFARCRLTFGPSIDPGTGEEPDAVTSETIDTSLRQLAESDDLAAPTLELEGR